MSMQCVSLLPSRVGLWLAAAGTVSTVDEHGFSEYLVRTDRDVVLGGRNSSLLFCVCVCVCVCVREYSVCMLECVCLCMRGGVHVRMFKHGGQDR